MSSSSTSLLLNSAPPFKRRKLASSTMSPISRVIGSTTHFETLELPFPALDCLDRCVWNMQRSQIKTQFIKVSREVHPDRHIQDVDRAAEAFDKVRKAFEMLMDSAEKEAYVAQFGERLKLSQRRKADEILSDDEYCDKTSSNHNSSEHRSENILGLNDSECDGNDDEQKMNRKQNRIPMSLAQQTSVMQRSKMKQQMKEQMRKSELDEYKNGMSEECKMRIQKARMIGIRKQQRIQNQQNLLLLKTESEESSEDSDTDSSEDSDENGDQNKESDVDFRHLKQLRNKQRKRSKFR